MARPTQILTPALYAERYSPVLATPKIGVRYETILEGVYSEYVRPGDVCVDGGAHRGRHTLPLAKLVGGAGKVVACEPIPHLAEFLRREIQPQCGDIIDVRQIALGKQSEDVQFQIAKNYPAYSGLRKRNYPGDTDIETVMVRCQTLDELLKGFSAPRFIKLDLEGGEFDAIRGASRTLKTHRPMVGFEFGRQAAADRYGYTKEDVFKFFQNHHYLVIDAFGEIFGEELWQALPFPFYFFAVPNDDEQAMTATRNLVRKHATAVFEALAC